MPTPVIIKSRTGTVNMDRRSAKCLMFYCHPSIEPSERKEMFIDATASQGYPVVRRSYPTLFPTVRGIPESIGGRGAECQWEVNEGAVFKIMVNVRRGQGLMPISGHLFIRARKEAPYRRIKFKMLDSPKSLLQKGEVEGNFDTLTVEEAELENIKLLPQMRHLANTFHRRGIVSSEEIIREGTAPVSRKRKNITDGTNTAEIVVVKRRRSIG